MTGLIAKGEQVLRSGGGGATTVVVGGATTVWV